MQESIVDQSHGKENAFVDLGLPSLGRTEIDPLCIRHNCTGHGQSRDRRPFEGNGTTRGGEVSHDHKLDFIIPLAQVGTDVERVVVPNPRAASAGSDGHTRTIDKKFVASVSRKMQQSTIRPTCQVESAGEIDNATGSIARRRVNPVWDPDPIRSELIDDLCRPLTHKPVPSKSPLTCCWLLLAALCKVMLF